MTLVLVLGWRSVPVLWAPMLVADVETAKRSLAMRECRRRDGQQPSQDAIHRFVHDSCGFWSSSYSRGRCADIVGRWATPRDLLAVVWTDFPTRFNRVDGQTPTRTQVIEFLRGLSGREREQAMNYVAKAPRQITTDYRHEIETRLGWKSTSIV